MRRLRNVGIAAGVVTALTVGVGLLPGTARAASTVDVTYDLSDTELVFIGIGTKTIRVRNADRNNGIISGTMKLRYQSNSYSSMPILAGAAQLVSFDLTLDSFHWITGTSSGDGDGAVNPPAPISANIGWHLTDSPLSGSLLSGGTLTGLTGALKRTGTVQCLETYQPICTQVFGIAPYGVALPVTGYPSGAFNLAGSVGPAGGAQSTPHTLRGSVPAEVRLGVFIILQNDYTHNGHGGVNLVGREVLREAEGHDPKVIPEPGTLLLLGAGTAGLALVGRATRQRRG